MSIKIEVTVKVNVMDDRENRNHLKKFAMDRRKKIKKKDL